MVDRMKRMLRADRTSKGDSNGGQNRTNKGDGDGGQNKENVEGPSGSSVISVPPLTTY